jgi:hypothetical protein
VKQGYVNDQQCTRILAVAAVQANIEGPFQVIEGLIRYKGRVWIGTNEEMQQRILKELYTGAMGGHFGVHASLALLSRAAAGEP